MEEKELNFLSSLEVMGFMDEGGSYVRREYNNRAFVIEVDEEEDHSVDGIRLYEDYNGSNMRLIAYDAYMYDSVGNVEKFLTYCGCSAYRNANEISDLATYLQASLFKSEMDKKRLMSEYEDLSSRVDNVTRNAHIEACINNTKK